MKLARALLLISMAAGLAAQTSTWDTSGNGMLNGTYYFRHVTYQISNAGDGSLYDAFALYGTVNFTGTGTYSMAITASEGRTGQYGTSTANGTYSIAASGHGFLSNPLFPGDSIYGLVNAQGIFVGSSTENQNVYNDVFIAAPLATSPAPSLSTFKGSYSLAYVDLSSGSPQSTFGAMLQMNPNGAGTVAIGKCYRCRLVTFPPELFGLLNNPGASLPAYMALEFNVSDQGMFADWDVVDFNEAGWVGR